MHVVCGRYCVVECECPGRERERLIVAVNKLDDVRRALKQELPVLMTFPGKLCFR